MKRFVYIVFLCFFFLSFAAADVMAADQTPFSLSITGGGEGEGTTKTVTVKTGEEARITITASGQVTGARFMPMNPDSGITYTFKDEFGETDQCYGEPCSLDLVIAAAKPDPTIIFADSQLKPLPGTRGVRVTAQTLGLLGGTQRSIDFTLKIVSGDVAFRLQAAS